MNLFQRTPLNPQQQQHLKWFSLYRFGLALALLSQMALGNSFMVIIYPGLYSSISWSYFTLALIWLWQQTASQHSSELVSLQIYLDIIFLILLMHAAGGVASGLGMLLVICIIASSLLLQAQLAFVFAALASVGLLSEFLYSVLELQNYQSTSTQVGILGAVLFISASVSYVLSRRARENEALAQEQKQQVLNLSQLNEQIIDSMSTGVIVIDKETRVIDINQAACHLLGYKPRAREKLTSRFPVFESILQDWHLQSPHRSVFETETSDLQLKLSGFDDDKHNNTLIFVEDRSRLQQQFQQSKLASLGHLTASIAHEIRNPLSSIAHASELLSESADIVGRDLRMTEIIHNNSQRINEIIESVQQISRGGEQQQETFVLFPWIASFLQVYCQNQNAQQECFNLDLAIEETVKIHFNAGQLSQILTNLCDNAHKHAHSDKPIHIIARQAPSVVQISIADEGPGIAKSERLKILEPFYSSQSSGSGLGLYIVNQLCELNQAQLDILDNEWGGSSFRITINEITDERQSTGD